MVLWKFKFGIFQYDLSFLKFMLNSKRVIIKLNLFMTFTLRAFIMFFLNYLIGYPGYLIEFPEYLIEFRLIFMIH